MNLLSTLPEIVIPALLLLGAVLTKLLELAIKAARGHKEVAETATAMVALHKDFGDSWALRWRQEKEFAADLDKALNQLKETSAAERIEFQSKVEMLHLTNHELENLLSLFILYSRAAHQRSELIVEIRNEFVRKYASEAVATVILMLMNGAKATETEIKSGMSKLKDWDITGDEVPEEIFEQFLFWVRNIQAFASADGAEMVFHLIPQNVMNQTLPQIEGHEIWDAFADALQKKGKLKTGTQ